MRVLLSVLVLLALAGCASLAPEPGTARVTGEAIYLERIAVPPDARLEVVLEDISRADAPAERIGEVTIRDAGQPPYPFTIEYDAEQIDPGQRIESRLNYSLSRQPAFEGLEPRLLLRGQYRYMADAGIFRECLTGLTMPVATEGDNRALEETYLAARGEPGEEMMISLEGRLAQRMPMEGPGPVRTLVPERFIGVWPEQSCPSPIQRATLKNTYWRLTLLGSEGAVLRVQNQREPHLVFHEDGRVAGSDGCNTVSGAYTTAGSKVTLSRLASTRKACLKGMEQAKKFLDTLDTITSYRIIGQHLEMLDGSGGLQLRFEMVALP